MNVVNNKSPAKEYIQKLAVDGKGVLYHWDTLSKITSAIFGIIDGIYSAG